MGRIVSRTCLQAAGSRAVSTKRSPKRTARLGDFPVNNPVSRGDWFASDCILRHPVLCIFISGDISQESRKYARIRCTPERTQRRRNPQDNAFESIRVSFLCSLLGQFGSEYKKPIASSNSSRENRHRYDRILDSPPLELRSQLLTVVLQLLPPGLLYLIVVNLR